MAAFANRYAQAFLDVVNSAKLDTAAIDAQLKDFLGTWEASSDLRGYFENPAVAALKKVEFLDKLNGQLGLGKELRNLLAVMINNDRIAHIAEVAAAYRRLLQEQSGIRQAEIVTARELSAAEREYLIADVARMAGAKIDASFKQDATILGGAIVRIGSTVYDGSVRGRLDRLKETLIAG
jgi:F-type H+-transporting ATPase subunit delta